MGQTLDTVYGEGVPGVHLYFSFEVGEGGNQYGHWTVLVPTSTKSRASMSLPSEAPLQAKTLVSLFFSSPLYAYIYIYVY